MNSQNIPNVISSPELAAGLTPSDLQAGQTIAPSGPEAVPASRLVAPEKDLGSQMKDISGQSSENLLSSANLQRSLESKLRARLDVNGSPEYALIWKTWDMPSGGPICALRASGRRISDSGYTGVQFTEILLSNGEPQTQIVGWPTTQARDWKGPQGKAYKGESNDLPAVANLAQLAGWRTPRANDFNGGITGSKGSKRSESDFYLPDQVLLVERNGGPSSNLRKQVHGTITNSCPAETANRGALNPAHSRWLQGYPVEWCQAAIRAFRKLRPARNSESRA